MSVILDGMDQAKFKCPRLIEASTPLQDRYRPQLHMSGAIAHGFAEVYFVGDADIKKDANASCQQLAEVLDVVQDICTSRQQVMPRHLCVQLDNTTRENKNQLLLRFCAWLVAQNRFDSATLNFFRKGHTHEDFHSNQAVWQLHFCFLNLATFD